MLSLEPRSNRKLKLVPLYSAYMITPIVNMLAGLCALECLKVYLAWDGLYMITSSSGLFRLCDFDLNRAGPLAVSRPHRNRLTLLRVD